MGKIQSNKNQTLVFFITEGLTPLRGGNSNLKP